MKKPSDFPTALKDAVDIEYALDFDQSGDSVNALTPANRKSPNTVALHCTLETLTKCLESLETVLQKPCKTQVTAKNPPRRHYEYVSR